MMMQASLFSSPKQCGITYFKYINTGTIPTEYDAISFLFFIFFLISCTSVDNMNNSQLSTFLRKYIGYSSRVDMTISVDISILSKHFTFSTAGAKDNPEN